MQLDGSGRVHLVQSLPILRPDEQVLQLMLDGWRNQQLSRNLQFATIEQRLRDVQRFIDHVNEDPWNWTPSQIALSSPRRVVDPDDSARWCRRCGCEGVPHDSA